MLSVYIGLAEYFCVDSVSKAKQPNERALVHATHTTQHHSAVTPYVLGLCHYLSMDAYFVLCVKQVPTITPAMPKWRPLRSPATRTAIPAAENIRLKIH